MPYMVIWVDHEADAKDIVFNDKHGNTQYIGDITEETKQFSVVEVIEPGDFRLTDDGDIIALKGAGQ
jgi:hypothetical protein